jgi:membrane protease YdiL (CAAX protease family)
MSSLITRFPLLSYFVLAYLFTWSIEVPMLLAARGSIDFHLPLFMETLASFGPFAAAVVVLKLDARSQGVKQLINSLLRWRVPLFWLLMTVLSPFVVMLLALVMTGETDKLLSGEICRDLIVGGRFIELIVFAGVLRGLGEEPGWRGYALPVLRGRFGPLLATLALWPVWLCWHLPSFLMRDFQLGAWLGFSFGILAASVWSTLLYDRTRSVLMIAIWHALINITRGMAGAASTASFLAFAQIVTGLGVAVILYWLFVRPGPYGREAFSD